MDTRQRNIMIGITFVIVLVLADGWYMSSVMATMTASNTARTTAATAPAPGPASSGAK